MIGKVLSGIFIPFFGTMIGSSVVFFIKRNVLNHTKNVLSALAGGIMLAASIWSLIIPSVEMSAGTGVIKVLQTVSGFFVGTTSMIIADRIIEKNIKRFDMSETYARKTLMQLIAVTVHNIPEGMAVGMVFASLSAHSSSKEFTTSFLLASGIAIQNIPEGAIVTMPVLVENQSRRKALLFGLVSGIVEPFGAFAAIIASEIMASALPFFLSYAAGAMMYVVVEQLIPDMYFDEKSKGDITLFFVFGFLLMMSLDVIFG